MTNTVVDLLPRDAELARRAAGGDGAAFVRLYDRYSGEVFAASLAATGSTEAAADATQTAFLRVLRWPPALGAPDHEVAELLCALALGGRDDDPRPANGRAAAHGSAVGWLRSETVATAGARFDADWSTHLWHPRVSEPANPLPPLRSDPTPQPKPRRRLRLVPRLALPLPGPAATAVLVLALLGGAGGTLLTQRGADSIREAPVATPDTAAPNQGERAELRSARARQRARPSQPRLLRNKSLEPLLAP